jgi:hypothetical protein
MTVDCRECLQKKTRKRLICSDFPTTSFNKLDLQRETETSDWSKKQKKNMPAVEMSQLPGTENSGMKKGQFGKNKPISFLECCRRSSAELIILRNIQPSNPV